MNSFWSIVGFEYKKIIKKKSAIITLVLTLAIAVIGCFGILIGYYYVDGKPTENKYDAFIKDRTYARALAGRPIESELLLEASKSYAKIPAKERYTSTDEYQLYGRPYSEIFRIVKTVCNSKLQAFGFTDIQNLTREQADNFYNARHEKLKASLSSQQLNEKSKGILLAMDEKISKPLIYDYTDGYTRFFAIMFSTGMIISFSTAICLSPIFSGEFTSGADQIILSTKHGKKKLILAKLFTGITLSAIICSILTILTYFVCMLIYGFDGANAPFQLYVPMCAYPFTMIQVVGIYSICILFANLLSAAITLLLSAKLKSPFGVIIIISVSIFFPLFVNISDNNTLLLNLTNLLPSNMMEITTVISPNIYELFGLSVLPYVFLPSFAIVVSILLLLFAYRIFKNHQIR